MYSYKIVDLSEPLLSQVEKELVSAGKEGWELVHIYNNNGFFISNGLGNSVSGAMSPMYDAFGRTRVAQIYTLGDYKHAYALNINFLPAITASGGSVTFNPNKASVTLATSASATSYAIHQTRMYHNYMPGKSQVIFTSFVFGAATSGSTKRTGYFDDYNGIFVEQDATGSINLVIRSSVNGTGSLTENRVRQENWNVNTLLDGPFIFDVTKTQLFFTDFQWLGVGRVRCGFVHKGMYVICHTFDHSNEIPQVYMSNPNLPVRCEIRNSTKVTASMDQICATVASEGGSGESGITLGVTNSTLRSVASGASVPMLAIRLKNSYNGVPNRAYVRLAKAEMFAVDRSIKYRVYRLPNQSYLTTGSAWVSANDDSVVEYNDTATAYTDGRELLNGFVAAGGTGTGNFNSSTDSTLGVSTRINYIAQNYDSTDSEIYVIVATNLTGTATTAAAGLEWIEIY